MTDRLLLTDAGLRRMAAVAMHLLVQRLAEDLDWIVGDLGNDAATVTVGALVAEGRDFREATTP